jgi:RNA polymerase sigma factor (sigma-70 family)
MEPTSYQTLPPCSNFTISHPHLGLAEREHLWVQSAQHGNLNAYNELVLIYQNIVFRQAIWILKDEEAASDATQETFLQAYRKLESFRGGSFRAWLLKIATNHCLDLIRSSTRHLVIPLEQFDKDDEEIEPFWMKDPAETPEQAAERSETSREIAHAIQRLAPDYREIILLIDLQELEYEEASIMLRIPVGTVKSRVARARRLLTVDLQNRLNERYNGLSPISPLKIR